MAIVLESQAKGHLDQLGGHGNLRPLDERHRIRVQVILEPGRILALEPLESKQVEMRDRKPALVAMPEREGRRRDRTPHPEGATRSADQRGLARSDLAADEDEVARAELGGEASADRLGLGGRGAVQDPSRRGLRQFWSRTARSMITESFFRFAV